MPSVTLAGGSLCVQTSSGPDPAAHAVHRAPTRGWQAELVGAQPLCGEGCGFATVSGVDPGHLPPSACGRAVRLLGMGQSTQSPGRPRVAMLGTGIMGAGMATTIAGAGMDLVVWNRSRERAEPLAEKGATIAGSPAEAVREADVVVTMLWDADSVADVMNRARGSLKDDAVWVQTSTVGVEGTERLAGLASDLGVAFVDAPVLGTKKPAEDGALVVLASGPQEVRERIDPVLDAISSRVLWVGEAGSGSRLKLVANAWVATVVEGVAECLTLAEALDLEPGLFLEAIRGGALDAPYVGLKGRAMLAGDFTPSFTLAGAAKDTELIVAAGRAAGADIGVLEAVAAHMARAAESGDRDLDMASTYLSHR